jgi:chemotaxis protein methyltransferase CheR
MPFTAIPDAAALARAIVDTVRDPLLVLDEQLRIVAGSRAFYQTFQLVDLDILGRLIYEIEDGNDRQRSSDGRGIRS